MHIYIYLHTYAYAYICTRTHMRMHDTVHTLKHWHWDPQSMHKYANHTNTHVYKRIHIHIHTHMHIHTYIHVRTRTHIHMYTHTHPQCTYESMQARLERRRGSERARSCCRHRKPCTSLSFDAIKPHLVSPMQGLHCTHCLRHQYPSTPHPLFPTYPRTVRKNGPLRSCRKIRGKAEVQQNPSRWARRTSSPENDQCDCSRRNERSMRNNKTRNSPSHNHDSAAPRQYLLICTGAGLIHPVHGQPMLLAAKAIVQNEVKFLPFSRAFLTAIV